MPLKTREESKELKILRSLNTRMELAAEDKKYYLNLKKGYEGEIIFDEKTAHLDSKFYILNDLLLKNDHTTFQIDSLFITQRLLIPFEVKNFDGDYYYENDDFHLYSNRKKIKNPLHQLDRSETQLHDLLQKQGFHIPVSGYLIFINSEFTLYQSPINKKIIYPTQINRLLKELISLPSNLNGQHRQIADFLLQSHMTDSPFSQVPPYEYEPIRKGMTCSICQSFDVKVKAGVNRILCGDCGFEEKIDLAIVRSAEELKLLFPEKKITTNLVFEWCGEFESKKVIRRVLKNSYCTKGYGKWFYYE